MINEYIGEGANFDNYSQYGKWRSEYIRAVSGTQIKEWLNLLYFTFFWAEFIREIEEELGVPK